ncbi:MAG: hypothetical protein ACMXX7_01400 [Candidatus Woesearchaeota archaeon]
MNKIKVLLWSIFIFFFSIRLFIAFSIEGFNYDGYVILSNISSILTGNFEEVIGFFSLYNFILSFFSLYFDAEIVLKVIPNFFGASIVFVSFYLSSLITKNDNVSLIASFISGCVPVFFVSTINNGSIYNFVIPLFFLCIYFFMLSSSNSKFSFKLLFSLILLSLTHPLGAFLVLVLLVHLLLMKIQGFRNSAREPELIIFYTLFVTWISTLLYRDSFLLFESLFVWQNIPRELLSDSYGSLSSIGLIYGVGLISLVAGFWAIYYSFFYSKRKVLTILSSVVFVSVLMIFLQLIEIVLGLILIGVSLSILGAFSLDKVFNSLIYIKLKNIEVYGLFLIVLVQLILFFPSIQIAGEVVSDVPSLDDKKALVWLSNQSEGIVLGSYNEGGLIKYYSDNNVVITNNFFNQKNVESVFRDVNVLFRDRFLTTALNRLTFYDVSYIFLSEYTQKNKNISSLLFEDNNCVVLIYDDNTKIYDVRCTIDVD